MKKYIQERVNRLVAGLPVFFVFKSSVCYDMYFKTADSLLKYNADSYSWVKSEFNNIEELVEKYMDKYPVYANSEIFDILDWDRDDIATTMTNVSLEDWK